MCNKYTPLHIHSTYSLLDGMPSPTDIVKRSKELGCPATTLLDHGNISGMVEFAKAGKKHGIKTIQGIELYICQDDPTIKNNENNKRNHLTVIAKNEDGIKDLMKLVKFTNRPDIFYRKPRIDLKNLYNFTKNGNLICLSGCLASELSEALFIDINAACKFGANKFSIQNVKDLLKPNWKNLADEIVSKYQKVFGKDNYFIEIQTEGMMAQDIVVECLREVSSALDIPSVASLDAHYLKKEDAEDHKILLYSQMHTSASEQEQIITQGGDTMAFFYLNEFYIYSYEEMKKKYTDQEIENTLLITDMIKPYTLGRKPCLPKFNNKEKTDKKIDSNKYLQELCISGAKQKLTKINKDQKRNYWERLQNELKTIKEANLADYFLIVYDACKFIDDNNGPRGKGRGSGAGSLVNYLLNITKIDPIEYNLYFERFYNVSRNIPPHFNVGTTKFMDWLSENYSKIVYEDIILASTTIRALINEIWQNNKIKSKKLKEKIIEECSWINNNNIKMWSYIWDCYKLKQTENPDNSLIFGILNKQFKNIKNDLKINEGHISLPDIDIDVGVKFRDKVIGYLVERWGRDKVSQMITFGRLQGKAALKEVFRAQPDLVKHLTKVDLVKRGEDPKTMNKNHHEICNEITSLFPNEAEIADELQEIRDTTDNESFGIIDWAIDNIDKVKEYYDIYKPLFDQARRIEGTKKNAGKHAAGIIIANEPIDELVPMTYDAKTKNVICGLEMNHAEALGCTKFDFLGVVALDKLRYIEDLING